MNTQASNVQSGTINTPNGEMHFVKDGIVNGDNTLKHGVHSNHCMLFTTKGSADAYRKICEEIESRLILDPVQATWLTHKKPVTPSNNPQALEYYPAVNALSDLLEALGMDISEGFYNEDFESLCLNMKREASTASFKWYIDTLDNNSQECRQEKREISKFIKKLGMYY
ncbi:hypothetical protein [Vibrio sp. D431a]|uniref:hypothetical protein n=1 Tax=Vibrio sp. D431a TaxID=2837388 RepID=UPI0025561C76|nr:hypothetical protein [Vibrio sp. D431a]MDK9793788.1 hypothetical protein [Vibrio sp. D431a]